MRPDVSKWWRLLGALIVAGLLVALVIAVVQEPRVSSQASPPKPAAPNGSLPAAMAPPTTAPSSAPKSPAAAPVSAVKTATHLSAGWGVDISWPQCGPLGMPAVQPGFAIVGINGGRPFTDNVCLSREVSYAKTRTGVAAYLNLDAPRSGDASAYGAKVALDGLARAQRAGLQVPVLWLDVEVLNHWSTSGAVNVAVINGALRALQQRGVTAGIYSSQAMWRQITGDAGLNVPVWLATGGPGYPPLPGHPGLGAGR